MSCLDLSEPIPAARRNPPAIDTLREDRVVSQANLHPRVVEQTRLSIHGVYLPYTLIGTLKTSA